MNYIPPNVTIATNTNRRLLQGSGGVIEVWWARGEDGRLVRFRNEDLPQDEDEPMRGYWIPRGSSHATLPQGI